ncbi:hypothetical protein ACSSS7_001701 [Eimeria intestinalis]
MSKKARSCYTAAAAAAAAAWMICLIQIIHADDLPHSVYIHPTGRLYAGSTATAAAAAAGAAAGGATGWTPLTATYFYLYLSRPFPQVCPVLLPLQQRQRQQRQRQPQQEDQELKTHHLSSFFSSDYFV